MTVSARPGLTADSPTGRTGHPLLKDLPSLGASAFYGPIASTSHALEAVGTIRVVARHRKASYLDVPPAASALSKMVVPQIVAIASGASPIASSR